VTTTGAGHDAGLLVLRAGVGSLLAAHGAGKLFGWFGAGYGIDGTAGYLEGLGFRPGKRYAYLNGAAELLSGLGLATGLGTPLAAAGTIGVMSTATVTEHAGKGLWVTSGGSEYPITVGLVAAALAHTGPGRFSLDRAFGTERTGFTAGAGALAVGLLAAALAMAARQPGSNTPGPIANTTADPDADATT
jgi:putative oxidoreductase